MAGLNIAEWTPDQVAEWLTGLGPKISQYIPTLKERGLDGAKLLMLRCDDLEYLGMHIIGHQELLLEAVEHLRNFQYEVSRECVQQLALRVSVVARCLSRSVRHRADARLETQTLADVARAVQAVKPLVCWLDRWPGAGGGVGERKAALLKLSLEAATCAQRERFAEAPARAVCAAAGALAAAADYLVQEVGDPLVLQPASVEAVVLRQRGRPLGFGVVPSFCGHHQLADVRFGSPAHAAAALRPGDELLQVGSRCVIGWGGGAVLALCAKHAQHAPAGDLPLRLRRRAAPTPPALALATPQLRRLQRPHRFPHLLLHPDIAFHRYMPLRERSPPPNEKEEAAMGSEGGAGGEAESEGAKGAGVGGGGGGGGERVPAKEAPSAASSSDESEPLSPPASPPASPTHSHSHSHAHPLLGHARLYPPKPRAAAQRRHSVSGGSPPPRRTPHAIEQFWQELKDRKCGDVGGSTTMSAGLADDVSFYARDKAVSYSTGLELSPRPRTCLGVVAERAPHQAPQATPQRDPHAGPPPDEDRNRGKLDKSHSTPAYDFERGPEEGGQGSLASQAIPESPPAPPEPPAPPAPPSPPAQAHSAEKADQILKFKKSSCQIGEAILHHSRRQLDEPPSPHAADHHHLAHPLNIGIEGTGERDESTTEKILETINIAMMEHRRRSILDGKVDMGKVGKVSEDPKQEENPLTGDTKLSTVPRQQYCRGVRARSPPSPPPRPAVRAPPSPPEVTPEATPVATPTSTPAATPLGPFPVLRAVPRPAQRPEPTSPLKPMRTIDVNQISVPLRHITKHDIRVIPSERRELPAINSEAEAPPGGGGGAGEGAGGEVIPVAAPRRGPPPPEAPAAALSPTSAVRGIFTASKNRSLKKKSSILAKRRCVPARALSARCGVGGGGGGGGAEGGEVCVGAGGACGWAWQRVRGGGGGARWAERRLVLAHSLLYAYRSAEAGRADCMLYLEGCTASEAGEVKSRRHAFKVYHTGSAFYFAAPSEEAMRTWIRLVHHATMLPSLAPYMDVSKQFSETDYSETESDNESFEKRCEQKEKEREKDKDKDKSKFGSLKKLAHRVQKSESHEDVRHSSTSLDRKYLRFFSKHKDKHKDESKASKSKQSNVPVPVPTGQYRSYRRVATPERAAVGGASALGGASGAAPDRLPPPLHYIHASNPNLLDFEKSDFVTKPALQVPPKPKPKQPENLAGLVTLEQFMLKKQEEERRQVYTDRVLLGVQRTDRLRCERQREKERERERERERDRERDRERESERERADHRGARKAATDLQRRLDRIVPDVIYGHVGEVGVGEGSGEAEGPRAPAPRPLPPAPSPTPSAAPRPPREAKPLSVRDKDGYERIVYSDEVGDGAEPLGADADPSHLGYEAIFEGDNGTGNGNGTGTGTGNGTGGAVGNGGGRRPPPADRWRDSLKRNDKVHTAGVPDSNPALKSVTQYTPLPHAPQNLHLALDSWSGDGGSGGSSGGPSGGSNGGSSGGGGVSRLRLMFGGGRLARDSSRQATPPYPHLQCPPTFQPETYSLAGMHPSHSARPSHPSSQSASHPSHPSHPSSHPPHRHRRRDHDQ